MHELQKKLVSPQILALPAPGLCYTLNKSASNVQLECVLLQEHHDGTTKLAAYLSLISAKAEPENDTTQRKCLVIFCSVMILRPFIENTRHTIRTDHNSLIR